MGDGISMYYDNLYAYEDMAADAARGFPFGTVALLAVLVLILWRSVFVVPQTKVYIVERLGKYNRKLEAGLHVKIPFIERVSKRVLMKEQVLDFAPQGVITKDNVTMTIDSVVFMRVFDATRYTYAVDDPMAAIESLAATTLRSLVGDMDFDATLSGRDAINSKMTTALDAATDDWGIKVTRVEVKDIRPPRDIEEVMQKQMTAEREKRKTILESEAHKAAAVNRAEGDKAATVMRAEAERDAAVARAEGEARSIRMVYEAEAAGLRMLAEAGITPNVLRVKQIEAMKAVANGNATKIFVPTDMMSGLVSAGVTGDALASGFEKPGATPAPREVRPADPCVHKDSSRVTRELAESGGYASIEK